jgi:hypothetical protein
MNDSIRSSWLSDGDRPAQHASLLDPCIAKTVIDADRGGDQVLDLAMGDGRKLQFEQPGHRHILDQDFLRLFVDLLTLRIRRRVGALGKQSVY